MFILCSNPYQNGPYYWVCDNTWSGTGVTTPYMGNLGTTSSATNTIWGNWVANQTQAMTNIVWANWISDGIVPETVPNQQAQERARRYAEAKQRRDFAQEKAMGLLREHLTPMQREALDKHGWFLVEGGRSKKTYRVKTHGCAGNIYELQGDKEVARYCVHAEHDIPNGDQWLAQMLSLRHDEEHIIGRANKTQLTA